MAERQAPRGREIGKVRIVAIVHADALGETVSPLVTVLPLATPTRTGLRLWRVSVPARDRLQQDCQAMVAQPWALDRARLGDWPLTRLTAAEMARVKLGCGWRWGCGEGALRWATRGYRLAEPFFPNDRNR
jgi:mRNA interferase MazF